MNKWLVIICFNFVSVTPLLLSPVHGHDGPLDMYGCHLDKDQKYYHCHDGVYKRLSFDSKTQMIQRLKNQYIALGRAWPYREATNDYEQQMPITETTLEPQSLSEGELKQRVPTKATQSAQLTARPASAKQTSKQPAVMRLGQIRKQRQVMLEIARSRCLKHDKDPQLRANGQSRN